MRAFVRWRLLTPHKLLNYKAELPNEKAESRVASLGRLPSEPSRLSRHRPAPRSSDNLAQLLLYRILSVLALLAYFPYAMGRSLAGKRRLGDVRGRLGWASYPDLRGGIWIHSVSVGEVSVARSLIEEIARLDPELRIGLSATTAAGRALAEASVGSRAAVFAFPFDLSGPVEKSLSRVRPGLVLLTETEIWPLFLERASAQGVPVALVNGRVSNRSYARYQLARRFFRRVLANISLFAMQSAEDAERIRSLGAPGDRVYVTGNIKYDRPEAPPFDDNARLHASAAGRPIIVAASTGDGEERLVLDAWSGSGKRSFLVIAPRRPERFDEVAKLVEARGLRLLRRSSSIQDSKFKIQDLPDVYLLDSIGELASAYRGAKLAFIGGSLIPAGGHNPIEAWAEGVPVVTGPHTENFREIMAAGVAGGFLRRVASPTELAREFQSGVVDSPALAARSESARRFVAEARGAAQATAKLVLPIAHSGVREKMAAP
jgi:3-deoxy-D-manno-octulosonic-acid transferase